MILQYSASRLATVIVCLLSLAACNTRDTAQRSPANTQAERAKHLDSAAIKSAEVAFRHFLDASREGSSTHDSLGPLTACGDDGANTYFPSMLLAGYSLQPFDMHGDTVVARASVVTVGEQDIDRQTQHFTARQRVREDPLEWDVIPADEPGRWVVCNGLRFGYIGADSLTTWRPQGASYRTARVLADSIGKARGN